MIVTYLLQSYVYDIYLIHLDFAHYTRSKYLCIDLQDQTGIMRFRQGSNELDTFTLVPGEHCQARLALFEPCLNKIIRASVGADLSCPAPIYRPCAGILPPGALMPNAMVSRNSYADRRSHIPAPGDSNPRFYLAAFGLAITMPAIPMISSRTPAPKPP